MATMRFVDKSLSVFVGNISTVVPHEEVEEVIYELFLQAGPLKGIKVEVGGVREAIKYPKGYAFVQFLHEESVEYASQLLSGVTLYGKKLRVCAAGQQEPQTPSPVAGKAPNGLPLLRSPANVQQMPSSSVQGLPSPMYPPSGPLYSSPHPISPQLSGPSTAQLQARPPLPHPRLPSPQGPAPLLPPNLQHTSQQPPQGYIPVASNMYSGMPPWQQNGYPRDGPINPQIHEARAYAHDHPHWLNDDVRQHLSDFHTSRLQGNLPRDDRRRARRHRNTSSFATQSGHHQQQQQQQRGLLRRTYSCHDDGDSHGRGNRGGPPLQRALSHDGNQPIRSRDNQAYRNQGRQVSYLN